MFSLALRVFVLHTVLMLPKLLLENPISLSEGISGVADLCQQYTADTQSLLATWSVARPGVPTCCTMPDALATLRTLLCAIAGAAVRIYEQLCRSPCALYRMEPTSDIPAGPNKKVGRVCKTRNTPNLALFTQQPVICMSSTTHLSSCSLSLLNLSSACHPHPYPHPRFLQSTCHLQSSPNPRFLYSTYHLHSYLHPRFLVLTCHLQTYPN